MASDGIDEARREMAKTPHPGSMRHAGPSSRDPWLSLNLEAILKPNESSDPQFPGGHVREIARAGKFPS